jgi:hypothetical protein
MVNFNWDTPDPQKVLEYVQTRGVRGKSSIEVLSRGLHFLDVFNTDIGFQLLCDLVMIHSQKLEKICSLEATEYEKLEYKICGELIDKWAQKINTYMKTTHEILSKING